MRTYPRDIRVHVNREQWERIRAAYGPDRCEEVEPGKLRILVGTDLAGNPVYDEYWLMKD